MKKAEVIYNISNDFMLLRSIVNQTGQVEDSVKLAFTRIPPSDLEKILGP